MAININEQSAMITQFIINELPDGLERNTAFSKWIFQKGLEYQNGGLYIQFPVKLLPNTTSGYINGTSDLLPIAPVQQNVYGTINWKFYFMQVAFSLLDYTQVGGDTEKLDFLAKKTALALEDAYRDISLGFWGTDDMNVDSSANTKSFTGMKSITSSTSYAGLTSSDYTSISTAYSPYAPLLTTDSTPNYLSIIKMLNGVRARVQTNGGQYKNVFGFTNQAVFTKIMANQENKQVFIKDASLFAAGVSEGFKINEVEFYLDADSPGSQDGATGDNWITILPMDILKFYYKFGLKDKQVPEFSGETRIPNQTIYSHQHFLVGNLLCNNRRLIGINKSIVA
jgi:hypothetical protein